MLLGGVAKGKKRLKKGVPALCAETSGASEGNREKRPEEVNVLVTKPHDEKEKGTGRGNGRFTNRREGIKVAVTRKIGGDDKKRTKTVLPECKKPARRRSRPAKKKRTKGKNPDARFLKNPAMKWGKDGAISESTNEKRKVKEKNKGVDKNQCVRSSQEKMGVSSPSNFLTGRVMEGQRGGKAERKGEKSDSAPKRTDMQSVQGQRLEERRLALTQELQQPACSFRRCLRDKEEEK